MPCCSIVCSGAGAPTCSPSSLQRYAPCRVGLPAGAHVGVALLPPPEKLKVAAAKPAKGSKSKALPAAAAGIAAGGSLEAGSSAAAAAAGAVAPRGLPGLPLQAVAPGGAAPPLSLEEQKKRPGQLMLTQMRARGQKGAPARQPGCLPARLPAFLLACLSAPEPGPLLLPPATCLSNCVVLCPAPSCACCAVLCMLCCSHSVPGADGQKDG